MSPSTGSIADSPEMFSGSLAHVVRKDGEKGTVIGQAWMVSLDSVVTCGHVVEPYLKKATQLIVKFPASGNEYAIDAIKMHPSFYRQPDQLIKYDAAVLSLRLREPEISAILLPIHAGPPLKQQQSLWTIRYPAHLAMTSAPDPLVQTGHFLGHLRKHDNFHLLHDLALAPGDSGAPILTEHGVSAMHCGDTASLPGLNLPTTAIRLALWVEALRDLGIVPTERPETLPEAKAKPLQAVCIFVTAALVAFSIATLDVLGVKAWMHFNQQKTNPFTAGVERKTEKSPTAQNVSSAAPAVNTSQQSSSPNPASQGTPAAGANPAEESNPFYKPEGAAQSPPAAQSTQPVKAAPSATPTPAQTAPPAPDVTPIKPAPPARPQPPKRAPAAKTTAPDSGGKDDSDSHHPLPSPNSA